MLLDTTRYY